MPGEAVPLVGGQTGAVEGVFPGPHDVDSVHLKLLSSGARRGAPGAVVILLRAAGPPAAEGAHGAAPGGRDEGPGGRLELFFADLQQAGRMARQAGDLLTAQAGAVDGILPGADDVDLVHGVVSFASRRSATE